MKLALLGLVVAGVVWCGFGWYNDDHMLLTSSAFSNGESIPTKYTCEGEQPLSPPLSFVDVPEATISLVLIMEDPDVPQAVRADQLYVHWVLFNIPPETTVLPEGQVVGVPGVNTSGGTAYVGPCPPAQFEPTEHRYVFTLYALDTTLALEPGVSKDELLAAMAGHVIDQAVLTGRYKKIR